MVTYRETALFANGDSSAAAKQRVAYVVAHELAHQWFGNRKWRTIKSKASSCSLHALTFLISLLIAGPLPLFLFAAFVSVDGLHPRSCDYGMVVGFMVERRFCDLGGYVGRRPCVSRLGHMDTIQSRRWFLCIINRCVVVLASHSSEHYRPRYD